MGFARTRQERRLRCRRVFLGCFGAVTGVHAWYITREGDVFAVKLMAGPALLPPGVRMQRPRGSISCRFGVASGALFPGLLLCVLFYRFFYTAAGAAENDRSGAGKKKKEK